MVLLYNVTSPRSWEDLQLLWGKVLQPSYKKSPSLSIFLFLLETKIKNEGEGIQFLHFPPQIPLDATDWLVKSNSVQTLLKSPKHYLIIGLLILRNFQKSALNILHMSLIYIKDKFCFSKLGFI